jgi:hypothetical protein
MIDISLRLALRRTPVQPALPGDVWRVCWDDENPDWNYKCRTQFEGYHGPDNPPAINRFAPAALPAGQRIGDYRVNIEGWKQFFLDLNGGDYQKFEYWTHPDRAQFNSTGWPQLAYLVFSGNELRGERVGEWFKFETLKPGDVGRAAGMTLATHPHLIHRFTCVTWKDNETVHIPHTGTPRGDVHFPVITKEGYGFIPFRNVVRV